MWFYFINGCTFWPTGKNTHPPSTTPKKNNVPQNTVQKTFFLTTRTHTKARINLGVPEEEVVLVPLVAPVVLFKTGAWHFSYTMDSFTYHPILRICCDSPLTTRGPMFRMGCTRSEETRSYFNTLWFSPGCPNV